MMMLHLLSSTVVLAKENVFSHKFPCSCVLASIPLYRDDILRSLRSVQGLHMALS